MPLSASTAHKSSSKSHSSKAAKSHHARHGSWKHHGQQKIDSDRARDIQQALIREKYLDGEPSGTWDERTKDALVRYQADHGWQTKMLPDSRALIALGLGPKHDNVLNPESLAPAAQPGAPSAAPVGGEATRPLQQMSQNQQ